MNMRAGIYRVLRIAVVAGGALLGYRWLEPMGLGWVVLAVAGVAAVAWVGYRLWLVRRERAREAQADRWAEALMSPPMRPAVITELRAERARASQPAERARLSLVLAEVLEADGDAADAVAVLEEVSTDGLTPMLAAVVRHARAVAHVSAGDPEAAIAALDAAAVTTGDASMELRLRMMRGLAEAERGNPAEAKRIAAEAREEALDEELRLEARVLEAVALDAAGQRAEALTRMHRIGDDMLEVLLLLGLPRVRELAGLALEARADD